MAKIRTISPLHGPVTQSFMDQIHQYQLNFLCEQCAFFNEDTGLCVHGYPNETHRSDYFKQPIDKVLIFCREFELD